MPSTTPLKIAVLISGTGSNLQAIIKSIDAKELDAQICLVVASRPSAAGIAYAKDAGIPVLVMTKEDYTDPLAADRRIVEAMQAEDVDWVVMAGYMRKVTQYMLDAYQDRVLNIHPALLPSFPGAHAIQEAYDRGVKLSGVTIHIATADYDDGPFVAQGAVELKEGMSIEAFEAAIHALEHQLYPATLQKIAEKGLLVDQNRKVVFAKKL